MAAQGSVGKKRFEFDDASSVHKDEFIYQEEKERLNDDELAPLDGGWVVELNKKKSSNATTKRLLPDVIYNSPLLRNGVHGIKKIVCGWAGKELIDQLKLCFPIVLTWLFQNLLGFVSLVFVGHISGQAFELDSVALATSFINVTGLSVGIGLSSAADTLCSQTYGFKNYKKVGHVLQQGILILLVLCLFVWGFWLNTDNLLLLLQQPPCISRYAGYYTKIFALCLPAFYVYVMIQKYLQAQSHVWPFIIVGALANILNAVLHAVLLLVLDLGIIGAAISMVISNIFQPVFLIVYIRIMKIHRLTWGGWSWESLREWWQFLKLGIPGMAMICLEWVSYEIVVFVLGSIGEVELAINSILVNILVILFMLPLGISITGGIRVGNALGAGKPTDAKRIAYISLLLVVINAVLQLIFLQSIKNSIGSIYTEEEAVLEKLPMVVNVITPGLFFDQVQLVIQGILRGCGLQTIGAVINFFAFYFLGLPLGISLAFKANMGVVGVWIGLSSATTSQCIIYMIIVLRMNWKKQAIKAQQRASCDGKEVPDVDEEKTLTNNTFEEVPLSVVTDDTEFEEPLVVKDSIVDCDEPIASVSEECEGLLTTKEQSTAPPHLISPNIPSQDKTHHTKLLITKSSMFVLGLSFVVIAGVLSSLSVPESLLNGNFTHCTTSDDYENTSYILLMPSPTPQYY